MIHEGPGSARFQLVSFEPSGTLQPFYTYGLVSIDLQNEVDSLIIPYAILCSSCLFYVASLSLISILA